MGASDLEDREEPLRRNDHPDGTNEFALQKWKLGLQILLATASVHQGRENDLLIDFHLAQLCL